jgi:hypothetical protein
MKALQWMISSQQKMPSEHQVFNVSFTASYFYKHHFVAAVFWFTVPRTDYFTEPFISNVILQGQLNRVTGSVQACCQDSSCSSGQTTCATNPYASAEAKAESTLPSSSQLWVLVEQRELLCLENAQYYLVSYFSKSGLCVMPYHCIGWWYHA